MAVTPDGGGYWLTTSTGNVYAFGDAMYHGGAGSLGISNIVGLAAAPDGGYWLVGADGGIFTYGPTVNGVVQTPFLGSLGANESVGFPRLGDPGDA